MLATGFAAPSQAWNYLLDQCRWDSTTMTLDVSDSGSLHDTWVSAAGSWDGLDANVEVTDGSADVKALTENRGNTVQWTGITRRAGTLDEMPPCSNNRWESGGVEIVVNGSAVSGYDPDKVHGVAAHEIGHALGLGHMPDDHRVIMHNWDDAREVNTPQDDDKAGINAIY